MKKLIFLFMTVVAMAACSDDGVIEGGGVNGGGQQAPTSLTVDTETINISSDGGQSKVVITSTAAWTIDGVVDWCSVQPSYGGVGSTTISITTAENETYDDRSASLIVKSGSLEKTISVVQKQKNAILVMDDEFMVSAEGETILVEVKSNIEVEVDIPSNVDWIIENTTRGVTSSIYYFDIIANDTYVCRTAQISFANKNGDMVEEVIVTQSANTIPANVISYTSTNGEIVDPYFPDSFGAKVVSNTYEEGVCGVIIFDVDVTEIGEKAFYGRSTLETISIPEKVISINEGAFNFCSSLKTVIIPESVETIGEGAFSECSKLESMVIPNSVNHIGDGAFFECSCLTNVVIGESVTHIGDCAFEECSSISNITIPDSVIEIGHSAFEGCTSLKSITIPNGIIELKYATFWNCVSLEEVIIPDSVTKIESMAFDNCTSLDNIIIPNNVKEIEMAFGGCSSLVSVVIGNSVTQIGNWAFAGCSSLIDVYCKPSTPPTLEGSEVFDYTSSLKIYVPLESVDVYKSVVGWNSFASKIVGYDFSE